MIKAENIVKSFEGRTILNDISVEFGTGQTNLIIGRSGSGKTVLLKSLVGLHDVDEGAIVHSAGEGDFTILRAIIGNRGIQLKRLDGEIGLGICFFHKIYNHF